LGKKEKKGKEIIFNIGMRIDRRERIKK